MSEPARKPQSTAERLATMRHELERVPGGRRRSAISRSLRLSHDLCVLCAAAVRVAGRTWWRDGRDPRNDRPTHLQPWQVVWERWMQAAEYYRACAKWLVAARPWRDDLARDLTRRA